MPVNERLNGNLTVDGTITQAGSNVQSALTLTTTGTSGAATLVGSTLNIPQYSGGGSASGIHVQLKPYTGQFITLSINGNNASGGTGYTGNTLNLFPFIPNNTFTCDQISVNVNASAVGGLGRLLIYSDSNGKPNNQLFASSNIDCSTTGVKTITISQTFTAGTTYWIAWNQNLTTITIRSISSNWVVPIGVNGTASTQIANEYIISSINVGSEPTTITGITISNLALNNVPLFYIRSI